MIDEITQSVEESAGEEAKINYSDKTVAELIAIFEELAKSEDRMRRAKEAESIKTAFYRRLQKDKANADEAALEGFAAIESGFKACYDAYRKERTQYNANLEKERAENLVKKEAVIAELRALVDRQEDVRVAYPAFHELQDRWRGAGSVPAPRARDINESYQHLVEMFYDQVEIDRELRDLDFKKNHEAKTRLCEAAEALGQKENIVSAFNELQTLHERWKELGPVEKQFREEIWERFKAATSVVNKRYQEHFDRLKEEHLKNLAAKTEICEKAEAILERTLSDSRAWNVATSEISALQAEWRKFGYATKKESQKVYDRFRAACTAFFDRKKEYYTTHNDSIKANIEKKVALCEAAEALKDSTDWAATTNELIRLQKQWKEVGPVPHNKGEQLWKRFRSACNEFFSAREQHGNVRQAKSLRSEKDRLVAKYHQLEQDIVTYENNIGFFTSSKNSEPLIRLAQEQIEKAKKELADLGRKIRQMEEESEKE